MIKNYLAVLALVSSSAFAGTKPDAVIDMATSYDTIESAAIAGIDQSLAMQDGHFYEHCGVIVQIDSKFYVSTPVTGDPKNCEYHYHGVYPVALYHTHPNGARIDEHLAQFSQEDINQAIALKIPSFVGIDRGISHDVRVFNKGDRLSCSMSFGSKICFADGELVGIQQVAASH